MTEQKFRVRIFDPQADQMNHTLASRVTYVTEKSKSDDWKN